MATPIGALLRKSSESIQLEPLADYKEITVRLNGKGATLRGVLKGADIASERRYVARTGQLIMSRIDARHGAVALVPDTLEGGVVTNDFPLFDVNHDLVLPEYLSLVIQAEEFVDLCRRASAGSTNRVRIKESLFLELRIPLPPIHVQRDIVERALTTFERLSEASRLRSEITDAFSHLAWSHVSTLIKEDSFKMPLGAVAPLDRRVLSVQLSTDYQEIACRSFGRGIFQKPTFKGSDLTWQRPNVVQSGDVLLSNIKAWEGAIAVVPESDSGKVVSHRYLTLSCNRELVIPEYIYTYLLSCDGLEAIGHASPGTADRNRTLNVKKLHNILIPIPPMVNQLRLKTVLDKKAQYIASDRFEDYAQRLRRSILSSVFRGSL
jgi:type I restriction enzyme S subunit